VLAPFLLLGQCNPDFPLMGSRGFAIVLRGRFPKRLEERCTSVDSAIDSAPMRETKLRVRRNSWPVVGGALALAVIAWPAVGCRRKNPVTTPAPPPSAIKEQSAPDAKPLIDPTFLVQIWTETTPPGARIMRVSDGHMHGWTPEIVEVFQSAKPVQLRLELEGYYPVTREVSALSDGELKVVLEPIPKGRHSATKKSKGNKGQKRSN